jgi:hypothetical protein
MKKQQRTGKWKSLSVLNDLEGVQPRMRGSFVKNGTSGSVDVCVRGWDTLLDQDGATNEPRRSLQKNGGNNPGPHATICRRHHEIPATSHDARPLNVSSLQFFGCCRSASHDTDCFESNNSAKRLPFRPPLTPRNCQMVENKQQEQKGAISCQNMATS